MDTREISPKLTAEAMTHGFSFGSELPLEEHSPGVWRLSGEAVLRIIDSMPGKEPSDKFLEFRLSGYAEQATTDISVFGNDLICVDHDNQTVLIDGLAREFSPNGFRLLSKLSRNVNKTLTSYALEDYIWDGEYPGTNNLQVLVSATRKRLGEYQQAIRTVRGVGYQALSKF